MTKRALGSLVLSLSLAGAIGCSSSGPGPGKEELASGKADAAEKLCAAAGEAADCDVCEVADWYDDGECDRFCGHVDGDCLSDEYVFAFTDVRVHLITAAQGEVRLGFYQVDSFSAQVFAGKLRQYDKETRGCDESQRSYSTSRAHGVEMYEEFVADADPFAITGFFVDRINSAVVDEENRAVFGSAPSAAAGPECNYFDFYALRESVNALHVSLDLTSSPADKLDDPDGITYVAEENVVMQGRMHEYGGNGGTAMGRIGRDGLDYPLLAAAVVEANADRGCDEKTLSTSTEEAFASYDAFQNESHNGMGKFIEELKMFGEDTAQMEKDLADFTDYVKDPSNLLVVSSEHNPAGSDASESCLYYDYFVVRQNGDLVRFTIDHTD